MPLNFIQNLEVDPGDPEIDYVENYSDGGLTSVHTHELTNEISDPILLKIITKLSCWQDSVPSGCDQQTLTLNHHVVSVIVLYFPSGKQLFSRVFLFRALFT